MHRGQHGLTFVELTVVMAIASIVTIGLVSFYLNSQVTWMEGSTQALAQREGTLVLDEMTRRARHANFVDVQPDPDTLHHRVTFVHPGGTIYAFYWSSSDSLIHSGFKDPGGEFVELGPLVSYPSTVFRLAREDNLFEMRELALLLPSGQVVTTAGAAALYNR
jgi:prepilin-type N-terminal cleavage/methylation domain-containing protein